MKLAPAGVFSQTKLTALDLDAMTEIHGRAFPESFLTQAGPGAVKRYYHWILTGPHDICALGIFEDGQLRAYAVGGFFQGALSGYLKKNFLFLFLSVSARPKLWMNRKMFRKAGESLMLLCGIRKKNTVPPSLLENSFGVSVLAVDPPWQGQGFGKRLMEELESAAMMRKLDRMDLTVDPRNQKAIFFYQALGWSKAGEAEGWTGRMEKRGLYCSAEDGAKNIVKESSARPFVSVIMAVRNEARFIRETIEAVLSQTYPRQQMEILISDGLSDDGTFAILKEYAARDSRIMILNNPGKIVSMGLNLAIAKSAGEILVRVDGHTLIASDYVEQCVAGLLLAGADSVGGRMNASGQSPFSKAVAFATSTPTGVGNARFHYSDRQEWTDTVYLGAWRRSVFLKVGLFDETLVRNQDDEFHYRIRGRGGRILLIPSIKSSYHVRSTWKSLASQYFQYGFWKVRVLQKHPAQMQARHFAPVLLVLALLASALYSILTFEPRVFMLTTLFYLFGILAAALLSCRGLPLKFALSVSVVYLTLHLGYGAGFLCGLLHFFKLRKFQISKYPPADKAV